MKKSRIFMAVGTLLLAITAVFATKANKKFANVPTALIGNDTNAQLYSSGTDLLNSGTSGTYLKLSIYTTASAPISKGTLLTVTNGGKVYFN
jgi:hypothetical protein